MGIMGSSRRPTMKEIARRADVSVSTVSLVLNNRPGVSDETRLHVQSLLDQLGYERAAQGRPPASRSGTMAFVVYDAADIEASHNPFFAEIQRGIETEAKAQGYGLRVVYVHEGDDAARVARQLRALQSVGLILDASVMPPEKLRVFQEVGLPLVVIDTPCQDVPVDAVVIDNVGGTHAAVRHLIDLGHRRIGLCTTSIPTRNFGEREAAFEEARSQPGQRRSRGPIVRVRPTLAGALEDCHALLPTRKELPTAFFAANDIIASGLVRTLADRGIAVPQEVSVVGFDDLSLCELLHPPLTTVRVFKARMATMAVRRLIERISGPLPETVTLRIGTELVVRGSTGKPPSAGPSRRHSTAATGKASKP